VQFTNNTVSTVNFLPVMADIEAKMTDAFQDEALFVRPEAQMPRALGGVIEPFQDQMLRPPTISVLAGLCEPSTAACRRVQWEYQLRCE
jgi:hypothetical protein